MSRHMVVAGTVIGITLLVLSGCANTKNAALDRNWGRSYESMVFLQTANPDAGKDLTAVEGMDGESSIIITDEYRKTFNRPVPKKETITIFAR